MTVQYSILFIVPAKASITITHMQGWGFSEPLFQACNLHICATNMNYSLNCFVACLDNQKNNNLNIATTVTVWQPPTTPLQQ